MTRRQKREHILNAYAGDARAWGWPDGLPTLLARKRAALTALAQIDAGKRWAQVLREFER